MIKNIIASALVALVVALGVGAVARPSLPQNVLTDAGSAGQSFGATAAGLASVVFSHLTNLQVNQNLGTLQTLFQGDLPTGNPLQTNVSVGSALSPVTCNTGTSTLFAIKPPSGATSTVTFANLQGSVAQISDIVVGTSTTPGGMTSTSTLNVTGAGGLFGAASVAIGQVYAVAGFKVGPKTGYTVTGNGGYNSVYGIVVGPNEYLVGYATSTAVTGGNGMSACTYKIEWQN